jgi:hypothetical protein
VDGVGQDSHRPAGDRDRELQRRGQPKPNERQFDRADSCVRADERIVDRVRRIVRMPLKEVLQLRPQTVITFMRVAMTVIVLVRLGTAVTVVTCGVAMAKVVTVQLAAAGRVDMVVRRVAMAVVVPLRLGAAMALVVPVRLAVAVRVTMPICVADTVTAVVSMLGVARTVVVLRRHLTCSAAYIPALRGTL